MRTSYRRSVNLPWTHVQTAATATLAAMQALRTPIELAPWVHDVEEKSIGVVKQALKMGLYHPNFPVCNDSTGQTVDLLQNEAELITLLSNVGGSLVTRIAVNWMSTRMPDKTADLSDNLHTEIFVPWRFIDAIPGPRDALHPALIPEDVLAAFDAIWLAEEYVSAYAYVNELITTGGVASVQQPGSRTPP